MLYHCLVCWQRSAITLFNVRMRSANSIVSILQRGRVTSRLRGNAIQQCTCACIMAERRCSAHADVEQRNGGTLSARKPRDSLSSYIMVYSVPTGQVVLTSGQVVDSTCECSGVSTTDFYQLTGSVQLKLLNDRCSTKLPLPRNPPLLEM